MVALEGLKDGTAVFVREPQMEDVERSLRFFQALPPEDRRYLRIDATQREVVERRIHQVETGEVYRIVAVIGDDIVADGALEVSGQSWSRHLGEIRVIVAREYRGRRLGAMLIGELFRAAQQRGLEKVVARMAVAQTGARKIFERLGFRVDAVLTDHIKDSEGTLHDMIVMTCTLDEMWRELKGFYRDDDWPDG
ncbi:MAG: GNAT family N-acetyltransferase [Planctomycetota bacterium]|jgi:RimJ/RimL family protein N-acetyltransferase